jgi:SHS2 domain-containing protein
MYQCRFEELGHTAEIGLSVQADAPELLYACAARGMFSLLRTQPDPQAPPVRHSVKLDALDGESLLVDWLSELLYLYETTGAIFDDCDVTRWTPTHLEAQVSGRRALTPPAVHIKAVTYHQISVTAGADGWAAQVYFDI